MTHTVAARTGALLLLTLTVGCTSPTADPSTTTFGTPTVAPTNAATSSPDGIITTPTASPSPASPPSPAPSNLPPNPSPWPTDLTPDQTTDAQAALSVYRQYMALHDQVRTNPAADWATQISQLAAGTEYDLLLEGAQRAVTRGEHGTGTTRIAPEVTTVGTALVSITDCVDTTDTDYLDRDGTSINTLAPGSYPRQLATAQVGQFQDGRWLVLSVNRDPTTPC